MKKILITGSEGFIGSHLVEYLLKKKYLVKCLVQYNTHNHYGWLEDMQIKNLNIVMGDIRDQNFLEKVTKDVDLVINLAALITIPYSYISPKSYFDTNLMGTLNLLELCTKKKIRLIHTSTSEVYGSAVKIPISENHRIYSQSPYAASKSAADQLCISFFNSFKTKVTILRPFNTFGPRQSPRAIIPNIIIQALKSNKIKLGNIYTTRDFNYIDDIVRAYHCALKSNVYGETINLGTGREYSIKYIVNLVSTILKKKLKIIKDSQRVRPKGSEVERLCASNLKAKKLINWKPEYRDDSSFKKALFRTITWFKKNQIYKNHDKKYHY